jgi:hypothetical protein
MTKNRIQASPFQFLNLEELGVSRDEAESAVQYIRGDSKLKGAEAIAYCLMDSRTVWAAAGWLMRAPVILSFAENSFLRIKWRVRRARSKCHRNFIDDRDLEQIGDRHAYLLPFINALHFLIVKTSDSNS